MLYTAICIFWQRGFAIRQFYKTFLFFAAFVLVILSGQAQAAELLVNPGFEKIQGNGIALGWKDNSGWADVEVNYGFSNDAVQGVSQHINATQIASGAVQFVQQGASLVTGQRYKVSIWLKGDVDGPVEVMLRKRGAPYTTYASKTFRVSEEWSRYEFAATSAVDDSGIYFMVRFTGKGELWLDQASLNETTGSIATAVPEVGNYISNGSFELGLDRWAVKVRAEGGYRNEMPVIFADVRPAITTGEVPHGTSALQIVLPQHGRAIVSTPISDLTPGHGYTLSLWLKSKQPNSKVSVALSTGWPGRTSLGRTFVVNEEWARYEFTESLPEKKYHLIIETREPSSDLWVDKVQLVAGERKAFRPKSPVEIGFIRSHTIPLYYKNEPIKQDFCVYSYQSLEADFEVEVTSIDLDGKTRLLLEDKLRPEAAKIRCQTFSHPSSETGHFQLHAKISQPDGTIIDSSAMAIGVVPDPGRKPRESSPFGGHATFSPVSLNAMRMLGVAWLRMHPPLGTKWFIVEPAKGRFEFIDHPIQYAKSRGFHILGSLDSTPRWASSAPDELLNEQSQGYRAYPPRQISDWARYVNETVAHYTGVIDHWEIWNEPDSSGFFKLKGPFTALRKPDAYVELVKSAYEAAKQVNEDVVIVAGVGTRKPPSVWVNKLVENGILNYIDALSFHFYTDGRPGDALDITAGERVRELRLLLEKQGKRDIPIWESESGFALEVCDATTAGQEEYYCASQKESVAFIIRNYIEWISSGVEHWFFYNMFLPDRSDRPDFSRFFGWDRSPTALAVAYAVASYLLTDMDFSRKLQLSDDVSGALFTSSGQNIRVLWAKTLNQNEPHKLKISTNPDASSVHVINAMGNVIAKSDAGMNIDIAVNLDPVYVVEYF